MSASNRPGFVLVQGGKPAGPPELDVPADHCVECGRPTGIVDGRARPFTVDAKGRRHCDARTACKRARWDRDGDR